MAIYQHRMLPYTCVFTRTYCNHTGKYICTIIDKYVCTLGLSDSVNFTIMIVEIMILTTMNTTTMVDLLNISIQIKHGFLKYHQLLQF